MAGARCEVSNVECVGRPKLRTTSAATLEMRPARAQLRGAVDTRCGVFVRLSGDDTDVQLRVPAEDPATTSTAPMGSDKSWRSVATRSGAGSTATLTPEAPVTTRFVLVYLTSLPKEGSGYKGGIYEAEVLS